MKLLSIAASCLILCTVNNSSFASIPSPLNVIANTPNKNISPVKTLSGHTAPVRAIAISANEQILASGSDDTTIKLWNPQTGALLRTLTGHSDRIKSIMITPEGKTLISSSYDGTIKLWNLGTGTVSRTITEKSGINSILVTSNGKTLISASGDKTIKFSDLKTGKIQRILKAETTALAISPDGKTLFSGGENGGKIRLWNLATGKQIRSFTPPLPKDAFSPQQKASAPIALAVSNDGQMLLSGGYDDSFQSAPLQQTDGKSFKAWNLKTGKLVHNFSLGANVDVLAISPDSKTFVAGGLGREVVLSEMQTGKTVTELKGHAGGIYGLAFSRDGKTLYSGSGDKSIKVWRIKP
ncbi:WD-40 repeat protein [Calothrix sp. NIES-4101]|nr:WD-40 repeat protein [Calothrix sp. NIES-4101]